MRGHNHGHKSGVLVGARGHKKMSFIFGDLFSVDALDRYLVI